MIVDDDEDSLQQMRREVDFTGLGFQPIGFFTDGREALMTIGEERLDVVITGVDLPGFAGLEFARRIYEMHPGIKVIISTAYNEFSYAREAVSLKVYEYILKPVDTDEFFKVLKRCKDELDLERETQDNIMHLEHARYRALTLMQENYLNRLVVHEIEAEKLAHEFSGLGIDFPLQSGSYTCMLVEIDTQIPDIEPDLLTYAVFNVSQEIILRHLEVLSFRNSEGKTILIASGGGREELLRSARDIKDTVRKALTVTVSVMIGNTVTDLAAVAESYKGALQALKHKFLYPPDSIIDINEILKNKQRFRFYLHKFEENMLENIKNCNLKVAKETVKAMLEDMYSFYPDAERIHFYVQHFIDTIVRELNVLGQEEGLCFTVDSLPQGKEQESLDILLKWFDHFCVDAIAFVTDCRRGSQKLLADRAIGYIHTHYNDPAISLSALCRYLSINASHFSNIFKVETGQTFVEYLTGVRIQKAKELLGTTSLMTYEVAERVGYPDAQYFSVIFKKMTGLTPKEFQKNRNTWHPNESGSISLDTNANTTNL